MKTLCILIGSLTGLLLLSTLICGLWIKTHHLTDAESLKFHMNIGMVSVFFGLISVILLFVQGARH